MWANINFRLGMKMRKGKRKTNVTDEARRDLTTDTCVALFIVLMFLI